MAESDSQPPQGDALPNLVELYNQPNIGLNEIWQLVGLSFNFYLGRIGAVELRDLMIGRLNNLPEAIIQNHTIVSIEEAGPVLRSSLLFLQYSRFSKAHGYLHQIIHREVMNRENRETMQLEYETHEIQVYRSQYIPLFGVAFVRTDSGLGLIRYMLAIPVPNQQV